MLRRAFDKFLDQLGQLSRAQLGQLALAAQILLARPDRQRGGTTGLGAAMDRLRPAA